MQRTDAIRPPEIMRRKAIADEPAESPRKKLVDFLQQSAIITDKFTGTLTLSFQSGGLRSSKLEQIDPL